MQNKKPNPLNPTGVKFNKPTPPPVAAIGRSLPAKLLIIVLSLVITIGGWRAMIIDADIKQAVAQEQAAAEQRAQAAEDAAAAAAESAAAQAASIAQAKLDADEASRAAAAADAAANTPPPNQTDIAAEVQPTAQPVPALRVVVPPAPQPVPAPLPVRRPRVRTRSSK